MDPIRIELQKEPSCEQCGAGHEFLKPNSIARFEFEGREHDNGLYLTTTCSKCHTNNLHRPTQETEFAILDADDESIPTFVLRKSA